MSPYEGILAAFVFQMNWREQLGAGGEQEI